MVGSRLCGRGKVKIAFLTKTKNKLWKFLKMLSFTFNSMNRVLSKSLRFWSKLLHNRMSRRVTKPTNWHVHPAKTQISLGIRPVWSESSLCAQWVAKDPSFLHADSEDSDQTGQMPRLIWVWAHMPFCWFCHETAQISIPLRVKPVISPTIKVYCLLAQHNGKRSKKTQVP